MPSGQNMYNKHSNKSMENKSTTSSNPQAALVYAILVGFAFSANYTNHAPLKDWLMKSFDTAEHPFTKTMFGF